MSDPRIDAALARLRKQTGFEVRRGAPLAELTRFGVGGPADLLIDAFEVETLAAATATCRELELPFVMLGEGSNVIAADEGFRGAVVRYRSSEIQRQGETLRAQVGAPLQALVDRSIEAGLAGLHTLTRIPGGVGGAVYGNAGAYGRSMHESVVEVEFLDGDRLGRFDNAECQFEYRESVFKRRKDWLIVACAVRLEPGDRRTLEDDARQIRDVRDAKYPPAMRCAGSIFKNLYLRDLPAEAAGAVPERAVREGKVASAFFLEQVGAKGMRRGGIQIADYHANLIYNDGGGSARDLWILIQELKRRVRERFGFEVEEEVQYVGEFPPIEDAARGCTPLR